MGAWAWGPRSRNRALQAPKWRRAWRCGADITGDVHVVAFAAGEAEGEPARERRLLDARDGGEPLLAAAVKELAGGLGVAVHADLQAGDEHAVMSGAAGGGAFAFLEHFIAWE